MAKDIGPRIGIDGEKEYRAVINQIIQQAKTLDAEMKLVASGFDKSTSAEERNAATKKVLAEQIKTQEERVRLLKEQYERSVEALGENDAKTLQWKQTVMQAETQLNDLNKRLNSVEEEMHETGEETEKTGKKTEKTGKKTKEAGKEAEDAGEQFKKFGSVLADVGKAAAATMGALAAGAVALGKEVVQSFGELQQNLGGSVSVFGDYASQIQREGEEAYRKLGTSQSDYLATANKMGALFQGAGIDQQRSLELTTQAMQRSADMASVMGIETQSALDAVTNAAKGNYSMMDNLGIAMHATTLAAYAVSKGFSTAFKDMSQAEKAELAMQYFFENTTQYAGNFEREATETVSGAMGMMTASVQSFVAGLGNADADIGNLAQNVVNSLVAVVDNVSPVLQNLAAVAPEAVNSFIAGLSYSGVAQDILDAAGSIVSTLTLGLVSAAPTVGSTAVSLIGTLLRGMIEQLPSLGNTALSLVLEVTNVILENLDLILASALELVTTLALGIADATPELIPTVIDVVFQLVDTLTAPAQLGGMIDAALALILALVDGVIEATPRIVMEMPRLIMQLQTSLIAQSPKILSAGIQLIMALISGFIESTARIFNAGKDIVDQAGAGIKQKLVDAQNWGHNLIEGFVAGIKARWEQMKQSVLNLVGSVKSIFTGKSGFDTHSPSKWAKSVFENVLAGAENGVNSASPTLISTMRKTMDNLKNVVAATYGDTMKQVQYSADQILKMAIGSVAVDITADLDNDGIVSVADARIALQVENMRAAGEELAEAITYTASDILQMAVGLRDVDLSADINGDGIINTEDARNAMRIRNVLNEISASFAGIAVPSAPVSGTAVMAAKSEMNNEYTYNYGGVYFTVNAAEGQDPEEIAEAVAAKLQAEFEREKEVYK